MKKLILLLQVFCLHLSAHILDMDEVLDLSKQFRSNPKMLPRQDQFRKDLILKKFNKNVKQLGSNESTNALLTIFLQDYFKQESLPFVTVQRNPNKRNRFGQLKDPVFFLRDEEGTLQYVVKVFRKPSRANSRILSELSAMECYNNLDLPDVLPVHPLAVAIGESRNKELGFLLESAATGQTLSNWLFNYLWETDPTQQKHNFEIIKKALYKTGQALGELHSSSPHKKKPLSKQIINEFTSVKRAIFDNQSMCRILKKQVDPQALLARLNKLFKQVNKKAYETSFTHYDTNMNNILYDETLDKVYFIDLASSNPYLTLNGLPNGNPMHDLAKVQMGMIYREIEKDTLNELISSLYSGYKEKSDCALDCKLIKFYLALNELKYFNTLKHNDNDKMKLEAEAKKFTFFMH